MSTSPTVFRGKLNYPKHAENEGITIVLPCGLQAGDPALIYWQWTEDAKGGLKTDVNYQGIIDLIKIEPNETRVVGFTTRGYYRFDGELSKDGLTLSLTMIDVRHVKSQVMTLNRVYPTYLADPGQIL